MNLEQLELKPTDGEQYLAVANGNYFYIGPLLYEIAVRAKSLRSPVEIVEDLKRDLAVDINIDQVQSALDSIGKQINPAGDADGKTHARQRSSYIHFKVKLLGDDLLDRLTNSLSILFNIPVAIVLTTISVLATAGYYLFMSQPVVSLSGAELFSAYLVLFGIFFIHELGHAAATKHFGMKPNEISFGFYLIFPVFFADVSEAWSLNKRKRIAINLGGVYFQAIVSAILVGCAAANPGSSILATLLYTNIFVIVYSLMPFLRYDGYWIYSDFFNLPNLMGRSIMYPYSLWKFRHESPREKINWPLLVYSVSSYLFFIVMFYFIGRYVAKSIEYVSGEVGANTLDWGQFFSEMPYSFYFRAMIIIFMTSFLTYRLFRFGRKKFIENF